MVFIPNKPKNRCASLLSSFWWYMGRRLRSFFNWRLVHSMSLIRPCAMMKIFAHQPRIRWQATAHAVLQPLKQWWLDFGYSVRWRGTRTQWLPQKQVHREKSRVRRGFAGASHRWHRCFWYAVYWVWEVPAAWFLWRICGWCEIKTYLISICV